jgi:uncharacterized membrane protein
MGEPKRPSKASTAHEREQERRQVDRIAFFSDAVFAIAMTLLIVDIQLPALPENPTAGQLWDAIWSLESQFISYVTSFLVIAIYWNSHHRLFRYIERYDQVFVWLNILLLMGIAFIPFPTSVFGDYSGNRSAVVFYAATMVYVSAMWAAVWWYASANGRLIDDELSTATVSRIQGAVLAPAVVFALSIAAAYFEPRWTPYTWLLLIPIGRFMGHRAGRRGGSQ